MAFVPNLKGLERLLAFPIPWASTFLATSETFHHKNVNASIGETLEELKQILKRVRAEGRKLRLYVSTVFGCPYEGQLNEDLIINVLRKAADLGPDEITLSDTIGVAVPDQVKRIGKRFLEFFPKESTAFHFHNTYGLALAAAQAGFELGVRKFDGATGGIGGCPYAKGATGNVATEELAYAFYRQGALPNFPADSLKSALDYLGRDLKLELSSKLFDIWEKGGAWHGV
jgi:hydroxymethylglutaryl-CoA lyase